MAFRASSVLPADTYVKAKRICVQLKAQAQNRSATFAGGGTAAQVLATLDALMSFRDQLLAVQGTAGIVAYAQDQEDDPAYDVAAEFTAVLAAVDAAIAEIVTTLPTDGTYLLLEEIQPGGARVSRLFTAPQLANLVTQLDAVAATIT